MTYIPHYSFHLALSSGHVPWRLNIIKWPFSDHRRFKYLRLHSCGREGSCCWFSGCHSPPPLINRLVRDPESGRPAPILPGTVSRRAVGPAGGLSWLQISGVIKTNTIKYLWGWRWCTRRSGPHLRAHQTVHRPRRSDSAVSYDRLNRLWMRVTSFSSDNSEEHFNFPEMSEIFSSSPQTAGEKKYRRSFFPVGGWTRSSSSALRKSLLEDLSLGSRDLPPPSASGAGGIMRQQACSYHSSISMSHSLQLHIRSSLSSDPSGFLLSFIHPSDDSGSSADSPCRVAQSCALLPHCAAAAAAAALQHRSAPPMLADGWLRKSDAQLNRHQIQSSQNVFTLPDDYQPGECVQAGSC